MHTGPVLQGTATWVVTDAVTKAAVTEACPGGAYDVRVHG